MRNEKQFLVKEISEKIGSADYVYFVSFAGLKVKELEDLRKQLAARQKLPAYLVFNDATLRQMARKKPMSREELLNIPGVGEKKAARYGQEFLSVIEETVGTR